MYIPCIFMPRCSFILSGLVFSQQSKCWLLVSFLFFFAFFFISIIFFGVYVFYVNNDRKPQKCYFISLPRVVFIWGCIVHQPCTKQQ